LPHTEALHTKIVWQTNRDFWTVYVPRTWNNTPLDGKLAWVVLITYTLCILTLIEMIALK